MVTHNDHLLAHSDMLLFFVSRANTKLLCFTRTSSLIHNLPSMYPSTIHSVAEQADLENNLCSQVYTCVPKLVVCKLESARSPHFWQWSWNLIPTRNSPHLSGVTAKSCSPLLLRG